ncbi:MULTISPECIES: Rid family detoxifying hydrolase [Alteromonadaceae]|uniref:Rid family detoxifying hydrolase n=1 Tax=Alteromonadaceae TaxID=72275 RepID=UPI001C091CA8|nr:MULTISPECIES: Rid family detoxifying hydrolase [Aliiglaciecola]MBU2877164.1 Rid family detoxifying hydrolase [Aliiglaciecola lipolytica]MDO6712094.1 Rid family detoxifying hydrolase [Aliiglaciecola sp. 2_MG-2023]MDO6753174.1 Rid family detoxifying hydrolase [Aliiglaciecola sp. 1_MG-2023]
MKSFSTVIFVLCSLLLLFPISSHANPQSSNSIKRLSSEQFKQLNLPFSQAVEANGILYLSGELGVIPGQLKLVEGGVVAETHQALQNIKATLERFGSGMDKVIKCTLFLADINEWGDVNKVYIEYFKESLPARSAVAGSGLGLGGRVEIECMALAADA